MLKGKKMRILSYFVLTAAMLALLPRAAAAQNGYLEIRTGYNYVDMDDTEFDAAAMVGGTLGYMHDSGFRIEGEFSYRANDVAKFGGADAGGHFTTASLMLNILYEYKPGGGGIYGGGSPFSPYIGVGGGGARMAFEDVTFDLVTTSINDSAYVLAYQFIGGVAVELSENVVLTLDYRYLRAESVELTDTVGATYDFDSDQSTFMLGLRSNF